MRDWDAASGIDPGRVAEVLVTPAGPGPERRGSGYRVSPTSVLTAAHVVGGAARVRVRCNADRPGEWVSDGEVVWADADVDAAVVEIPPRAGDEEAGPVGFGRVAERDAVVTATAMGFPRFKLRADEAGPDQGGPTVYRDSAHVSGTVAVLSNRREGTLEVTVSPPERDPDPARSPWEGMSGAAVWSGGRIIGLVAEHHRSDGLGTLAASRVDRWYERLPAGRLDRLRALLDLPGRAADLVDVVPVPATKLLQATYLAQVRDLAPERLVEREPELEELVQFCAGEERYRWLHGPPWAGKSALAAWFVLHPPAGVTVVSFFVTRRLAGQTDSNAFTEAMVEQLAAVAGEPAAGSATAAGRDKARRHLLNQAAQRAAERGQRLLLVVDGLDEDQGAKPGSGLPSIASLLPERPPEAVRVLVTSRPHPGIPDDVPGDHPLRHCQPRLLRTSRAAHHIEVAAKNELVELLHGDTVQVDILGLITAGGAASSSASSASSPGSPGGPWPASCAASSGGASWPGRPTTSPPPVVTSGSTCSPTRPCGRPPSRSWPATSARTGHGSTPGWTGSGNEAGPTTPRSTRCGPTADCWPRAATSAAWSSWPPTPAARSGCCSAPPATAPPSPSSPPPRASPSSSRSRPGGARPPRRPQGPAGRAQPGDPGRPARPLGPPRPAAAG